jgi:hypothetical protein
LSLRKEPVNNVPDFGILKTTMNPSGARGVLWRKEERRHG